MLFKFGEAKRELVYGYYFAVFAGQRREARRIRDISAAELIQLDCPCRVAASAELIAYFARFERKLGGYQIEERGLTYAGIARKALIWPLSMAFTSSAPLPSLLDTEKKGIPAFSYISRSSEVSPRSSLVITMTGSMFSNRQSRSSCRL